MARYMGPCYFIEKPMVNILKESIPKTDSTLSSTKEFDTEIKGRELEKQEIMTSLDIVSLYPSIDMIKAAQNFERNIKDIVKWNQKTLIRALYLIIV